MDERYPNVGLEIKKTRDLSDTIEEDLKKAIHEFKEMFQAGE